MDHTFFLPIPPFTDEGDPGIFVQGVHVPSPLVQKSGLWVHRAGSAILLQNAYQLSIPNEPVLLIAEEGRVNFEYGGGSYVLDHGQGMMLPPNAAGCTLSHAKDARLLWMTLGGPLCADVLQQMNALSQFPIRQGVLPTQILLVRQIVQVLVRHSESEDASYQLAQLVWGIIAAHSGQSVAMMATLSHEIARVVDTLRANQYHDTFSLAEMAAISRMPVETFRKRFSSELGIPPLCYLQFLKMERAKTLLRGGKNVRQTGIAVGMPDPYHFSKQFKHVVGMSPTAYLKHVGGVDDR